MEWLTALDVEKWANAVVILIAGLAAVLGFKQGKRAATPVEEADITLPVKPIRAVVAAIERLAAAIEADLAARLAAAKEAEKARALGYRAVEGLQQLSGQVDDLQRTVADLAKEIARHR